MTVQQGTARHIMVMTRDSDPGETFGWPLNQSAYPLGEGRRLHHLHDAIMTTCLGNLWELPWLRVEALNQSS